MPFLFFGEALKYALILTVIVGGIDALVRLVRGQIDVHRQIIAASISFVLNIFVCWFYLYKDLPAMTGTLFGYMWLIAPLVFAGVVYLLVGIQRSQKPQDSSEYYSSYRRKDETSFQFGATGIVVLVAIVLLFAYGLFNTWFPYRTQGGVAKAAALVNVEKQEETDYPDTDANHIVENPDASADFIAGNYMAAKSVVIDGKSIPLSTIFHLGHRELQSVNKHLYWIFDLEFTGYNTWNQINQTVPGYIVVDAENPNADPIYKVGYDMRYTPTAYLNSKLERLIYAAGYQHYVIDDLILEVDDTWKPYYTTALTKKVLHDTGDSPQFMLVIDPQTGEITRYELDQVPEWVDRVYSARLAQEMMNWWGDFGPDAVDFRFINRPATGRLMASSPTLVYTGTEHPAYQMTLTSLSNKDTSIAAVVLFDARSNHVRFYSHLAGTAIESSVYNSFKTIPENNNGNGRLEPTHLALHQIYGEPTWVANFVAKSDSAYGSPYAGIGFVSANSVSTTNVAFGETMEEALSKYRVILARNPSTDAPGEGAMPQQVVEGTVQSFVTRIEGGNTVYLMILEDPKRVYKASWEVSNELAFTVKGDKVAISYIDVGEVPVDISEFNNKNVPIVP
jgi:hypothetical protein